MFKYQPNHPQPLLMLQPQTHPVCLIPLKPQGKTMDEWMNQHDYKNPTNPGLAEFQTQYHLTDEEMSEIDDWKLGQNGIGRVNFVLKGALEKIPAFKGRVVHCSILTARGVSILNDAAKKGKPVSVKELIEESGEKIVPDDKVAADFGLATTPEAQESLTYFSSRPIKFIIESKTGRWITGADSKHMEEPEVVILDSLSSGFKVRYYGFQVYFLHEVRKIGEGVSGAASHMELALRSENLKDFVMSKLGRQRASKALMLETSKKFDEMNGLEILEEDIRARYASIEYSIQNACLKGIFQKPLTF
jgi:hypothetical protein